LSPVAADRERIPIYEGDPTIWTLVGGGWAYMDAFIGTTADEKDGNE